MEEYPLRNASCANQKCHILSSNHIFQHIDIIAIIILHQENLDSLSSHTISLEIIIKNISIK